MRALSGRRFAGWAWALGLGGLVASYAVTWCVVHPYVDTHPCIAHLPDPLYPLIPYDPRWYFLTTDVYITLVAATSLALFAGAVRGDHETTLRMLFSLSIMAFERCATIMLVPVCRLTVKPGTVKLAAVPTLDLGLFRLPWRPLAANDLVFSGHVSYFLLLMVAARRWPRWALWGLGGFEVAQVWGLLSTRGHYTVDLLLAVPCCVMADVVALRALRAAEVAAVPVPVRSAAPSAAASHPAGPR
jgi:hypothetical protein